MTSALSSSAHDADLTDEQLVARVLAGRRDAFNTLIVRHERRLYRFLCKAAACEADVEDAMQQAAVKAYVKLRSFDPRYRFTTWLFTIALRELRSLGRGGGRRGPAMRLDDAPEPVAPRDEQPPDGPGELWQTARRVLSDTQYTALWLRYGEDLAAREIAKVMGRPRVWVSVTLHRACTTVRKFADQQSGDARRASSSPKRQADRIKQSERTAGGVS